MEHDTLMYFPPFFEINIEAKIGKHKITKKTHHTIPHLLLLLPQNTQHTILSGTNSKRHEIRCRKFASNSRVSRMHTQR